MLLVVYWIWIVIQVISMLLAVLGVFFSPIAAAICAKKAQANGWSSRRYALAGALYSAFYLLPFIYLLIRMNHKDIPAPLKVLAQVLARLLWVFTILLLAAIAFYSYVLSTVGALPVGSAILLYLMPLVSAVSWVVTLVALARSGLGYGLMPWQLR